MLYLPFSVLHGPITLHLFRVFFEAIHFICHFQCFMVPLHCIYLGSSGDYTLYLPFSELHDPIPLFSSRVFW